MQCTCVRQTDLPSTSKLFADLLYSFDRVRDLYSWAPNDIDEVVESFFIRFSRHTASSACRCAPLSKSWKSFSRHSGPTRHCNCSDRAAGGFVFRPCLFDLQSPYRDKTCRRLGGKRSCGRSCILGRNRRSRFRGSRPHVGLRCGASGSEDRDAYFRSERNSTGRFDTARRNSDGTAPRRTDRFSLCRRGGSTGATLLEAWRKPWARPLPPLFESSSSHGTFW